MAKTSFTAGAHGFHFGNNNIRWSFGVAGGRNLCGGMAFGCLDFFFHRMPIPTTRTAPQEGTPLHTYILARQMHAHRFAIPRLVAGDPRFRGDSFDASLREDQNFGIVKRSIAAAKPIPILLSAAGASLSTNSHWVVATGYEVTASPQHDSPVLWKLYIYDNNQPDVERELTPVLNRRCFQMTGSRREYGYYLPFEDYVPIRPSAEAMRSIPSATELATNPFSIPSPRL